MLKKIRQIGQCHNIPKFTLTELKHGLPYLTIGIKKLDTEFRNYVIFFNLKFEN